MNTKKPRLKLKPHMNHEEYSTTKANNDLQKRPRSPHEKVKKVEGHSYGFVEYDEGQKYYLKLPEINNFTKCKLTIQEKDNKTELILSELINFLKNECTKYKIEMINYQKIHNVITPAYEQINTVASSTANKEFNKQNINEISSLLEIFSHNNNIQLSRLEINSIVDAFKVSTLPLLRCSHVDHIPFNKLRTISGLPLEAVLLKEEADLDAPIFFTNQLNMQEKVCYLKDISQILVATLTHAIEQGNVDFVRNGKFSENLGLTQDNKILVLDYLNVDQETAKYHSSILDMQKMVEILSKHINPKFNSSMVINKGHSIN